MVKKTEAADAAVPAVALFIVICCRSPFSSLSFLVYFNAANFLSRGKAQFPRFEESIQERALI